MQCDANEYSYRSKWEKLARIEKITQDRVYVRIYARRLNLNDTYNLRAMPNRTSFKMQQQALDFIDSHDLTFEILFRSKYEYTEKIKQNAQSTFQLK